MKTLLIVAALCCFGITPLWAQEIQNRTSPTVYPDAQIDIIKTSHTVRPSQIDLKDTGTSTSGQSTAISNLNSLANKTVTPCQVAHPDPAELGGIFPDLYCCSSSLIPHQQNTCLEGNFLKLKSFAEYLETLQHSSPWAAYQLVCNGGAWGGNLPPPGMDPDVYSVSANYQNIAQCLSDISNLEDAIKEKFGVPK